MNEDGDRGMNEDQAGGNRTGRTDGPDSGEDQRHFGAALGKAIGRQVGSPVTAPPVARIAERAAARARARRARQTVLGVAAAAALLAGGIVAGNALGGGGGEDSVLATGPTVVEQATGAAPADPAEPPGGGAARQAADPPEADPGDGTGAPAGGSIDATGYPSPGELSTGAVPAWQEFAIDLPAGVSDIYGLQTVGDGRIVARARGDGGDLILVTDDGATWARIPVPAGVSLEFVDVSADRWLVAGPGLADPDRPEAPLPLRAFLSDDEGATWTELTIGVDTETTVAPSCTRRSSPRSVLGSGDRLVVLVESHVEVDPPAALAEQGAAPDGDSILGWQQTPTDVIVHLGESDDATSNSVSNDESELAPDPPAPCDAPGGTGDDRVHVLLHDPAGDGSGAEQVAGYAGRVTSASGTPDGFTVIVASSYDEALLITSADGRDWSETPLGDGYLDAPHAATGNGDGVTNWYASWIEDSLHILRSGGGEQPRTVASFGGLTPGAVLAAGPAGVAATAWPLPGGDPTPQTRPAEAGDGSPAGQPSPSGASLAWDEFRVVKDGYELRFGDPADGASLWARDGAEPVAVYEFEAEALVAEVPSDGVRRGVGADGSATLTFTDPETGDDLVTFTTADLAAALEQAVGEPGIVSASDSSEGSGSFGPPPLWVGWSADGTAWGWQTAAEAFGTATGDGASVDVDLAVGDGFVLARVEVLDGTDKSAGPAEPNRQHPAPRWFIASVP